MRVVYDGVIGPWFLPTFATAAGVAELDCVVLMPSVDRCVERVLTRTGHGFRDEQATRRMYEDFASSAIDDRHVLRVDSEAPEDVAERVRTACADGSLRWRLLGP
jgi:hypothetical protein